MTAEIFVTDCKISCIFKKCCEVERISGNKPTESIFPDWEWFDGCGIGTPVHGCGVGRRGSGTRIHFWKKEPSWVCFHIIMVSSGRMRCINTTACGWKRSVFNTKPTLPVSPSELSTWSHHHVGPNETAHRLLVTGNTQALLLFSTEGYNRCLMSGVK